MTASFRSSSGESLTGILILIAGWLILSQFPGEAGEKIEEGWVSLRGLRLGIKSEREVFRAGEEVVFKITWTNTGKKPFYIFHSPIYEGKNLIIKDTRGGIGKIFPTVEYRLMVGVRENFHLLKPDQSFSSTISGRIGIPRVFNYPYKSKEEIKGWYIFTMKDTACYLKPGTYRIQYLYTNKRTFYFDNRGEKHFLDKRVWTGSLVSNTIRIRVE